MQMYKIIICFVLGFIWPKHPYAYVPFGVISFFTTGLYTVSWQFDPCVKYQVYTDSLRLARLPLFSSLTSASPTVLIRKDDRNRKILHCTVMLASTMICVWRLYREFSNWHKRFSNSCKLLFLIYDTRAELSMRNYCILGYEVFWEICEIRKKQNN